MNVPAYIKGYSDTMRKSQPWTAPPAPSEKRIQPSSYKAPTTNVPKPSAPDGMLINPR